MVWGKEGVKVSEAVMVKRAEIDRTKDVFKNGIWNKRVD